MASPEVAPYSNTGGLAEVLSALPATLRKRGHEVTVMTPLYKCVKDGVHHLSDTGLKIIVDLGGTKYPGEVWRQGDCYFIRNDSLFCRDELYGREGVDYEDNDVRFAFFSKAVLETLRINEMKVDVIHSHDWQTALIPLYMKTEYRDDGVLDGVASVFTVHNLAYQGLFTRETMDAVGLPRELFTPEALEFYGKVNFIKGGIRFADVLTTVSRRYAREIQESEMGCGLEGLLRERRGDLFGIVNGVDYGKWSPENDPFIPSNYHSDDLAGKKRCKEELRRSFGLSDMGDVPLVGMISRLDPQKGFDLIERSAKGLMSLPIQMVFLGQGTADIRDFLEGLAGAYPGRVGVRIGYDDPLAHRIEAGSDIYLMPSRYEPCGLNHLYSLRYGTIPVVRATGGLDDTIVNYSAKRRNGNGFKFRSYRPEALLRALGRAVDLYLSDREEWQRLQKRVMKEDHSWERSVTRYEWVYRRAMGKVRRHAGETTKEVR